MRYEINEYYLVFCSSANVLSSYSLLFIWDEGKSSLFKVFDYLSVTQENVDDGWLGSYFLSHIWKEDDPLRSKGDSSTRM